MPLLLPVRRREIMRGGDAFSDDLRVRQDVVLCEAERRGLTNAVLATAAGMNAETLRTYRRSNSRATAIMPLDNFLRIAAALIEHGHRDLAELLIEPLGCALAPRDAATASWLGVMGQVARFQAKACTFAEDGVIDHREQAELSREAGPLITILADARSASERRGDGADGDR